ncbi:TIGR04372 family glycosyltransferase [Alphaproteobacteria bacterium]|nr:TIGR04372 family glycosyltransferase [Alphaproteobacteria bacterium]
MNNITRISEPFLKTELVKKNEFLSLFAKKVYKNDVSNALKDLSEFIENYPTQRPILDQLYAAMLNEIGSTKHANYISKLIIKIDNKLLKMGRDHLNLPPISYYQFKNRVGEMITQTAATNYLLKLEIIKKKPVLPIPDLKYLANSAFLPYLNDNFSVLMPGDEATFYSNLARSSPFNSCHIRWDPSIQGHYSSTAKFVRKKLKLSKTETVAFKLKSETASVAEQFLKHFDLNKDDKFVTLHFREEGYYDSVQHPWRNSNINKHIDAIKVLLKQGIKVVRIGHPRMTKIPEISGLIDLTRIKRPPEVDIFLCAACMFFYGNPSGPCDFAYEFGTPMLFSGVFPYAHARPNSLNQITPLKNTATNKILSLKEIFDEDLSNVFSPIPYNRKKIEICQISADENTRVVNEMLNCVTSLNRENIGLNLEDIGIPDNIWFTEESQNLI